MALIRTSIHLFQLFKTGHITIGTPQRSKRLDAFLDKAKGDPAHEGRTRGGMASPAHWGAKSSSLIWANCLVAGCQGWTGGIRRRYNQHGNSKWIVNTTILIPSYLNQRIGMKIESNSTLFSRKCQSYAGQNVSWMVTLDSWQGALVSNIGEPLFNSIWYKSYMQN